MKINAAGLLLCTFLVGCGGTAPFGENAGDDSGEDVADQETIDSNREIPPGTESPSPSAGIFRKEPRDETSGDGYAENVSYNAENDTFSVENLPFDGGEDTPYIRGDAVGSLGQYAVYESVQKYADSQSGEEIDQFANRAIYGVSRSGQTEFAIVRSGSYINYGFGGFVYERNGTVTLPASGQGVYIGEGAGLRDFDGKGGVEYTTSSVRIAVDFDDFNEETGQYEGAVHGRVTDRRIYNVDGNEITQTVIDRINESNNASLSAIPTIVFLIEPNVLDPNGEILGTTSSGFVNDAGEIVTYGEGKYYGVISGDNAEELVGVIVSETGVDPIAESVRDTTGFTIYRDTSE